MKKYFLILIIFVFFYGCKKEYDDVVNPVDETYNVVDVNSFRSFNYALGDSLVPLWVRFSDDESVASVFVEVYASNGEIIETARLMDDGNSTNGDVQANDNIYSALVPLRQTDPNGQYSVKYFVVSKSQFTKLIAYHFFTYDNGQTNVAPMIIDWFVPDSIAVNTSFLFTVTVVDNNGQGDIKSVYFRLYRPDNTIVFNTLNNSDHFFMVDDGSTLGDVKANDSIYSFTNLFSETAQKGSWRFEFEALDRRNVISETVIDSIVVK